jgi:hypothetical protein
VERQIVSRHIYRIGLQSEAGAFMTKDLLEPAVDALA